MDHKSIHHALYTPFDVAEVILRRLGPLTAMKLQKLVYYCQAWSLVWDERPLFPDRIEAWKNGPVVRSLYNAHSGRFLVEPGLFRDSPAALDQDALDTIDAVINYYGNKTAQWLSDLTHAEDPWIEARQGLEDGDSGGREIGWGSMHQYYSGLIDREP